MLEPLECWIVGIATQHRHQNRQAQPERMKPTKPRQHAKQGNKHSPDDTEKTHTRKHTQRSKQEQEPRPTKSPNRKSLPERQKTVTHATPTTNRVAPQAKITRKWRDIPMAEEPSRGSPELPGSPAAGNGILSTSTERNRSHARAKPTATKRVAPKEHYTCTEKDVRKGLPAGNKTRYIQSHTQATKQGYATQSEAKPKTPDSHPGRKAGLNHSLNHQSQAVSCEKLLCLQADDCSAGLASLGPLSSWGHFGSLVLPCSGPTRPCVGKARTSRRKPLAAPRCEALRPHRFGPACPNLY
jgi:hypothetical protein